jgi:hypothetical protein
MSDALSDYDSPWKEALELYFESFMGFFFPQANAEINWLRGYEFLDKELQQIMPDAEVGKRYVDKLIKLWRMGGEETWVLVHIEIQSQVETAFAQRMYEYNYRLFDRYNRQIASLAVLGDDQPNWRPDRYEYTLFGCTVSLQFPIIKLLDYEAQWQSLAALQNPFAVLVMAHLKAQSTRRNPDQRYEWKLSLLKGLYARGYNREQILNLFRFINWMMTLPDYLEERLATNLTAYEEEIKMPYITPLERFATERGVLQERREAVIEVLQTRFNQIPENLVTTVLSLTNPELLKVLLRRASIVPTLEDFQQSLIQASRDAAIALLTSRFPELTPTVIEQLQQVTDVAQLQMLYQQVMQLQDSDVEAIASTIDQISSVEELQERLPSHSQAQ